eukprot:7139413-Heterocapsa_arctica.AAC.1
MPGDLDEPASEDGMLRKQHAVLFVHDQERLTEDAEALAEVSQTDCPQHAWRQSRDSRSGAATRPAH